MKRHNLPLGPLALEGERKRREVPAYVGHKLHVHHAGHDSTHDCAVILPLGEIGRERERRRRRRRRRRRKVYSKLTQ